MRASYVAGFITVFCAGSLAAQEPAKALAGIWGRTIDGAGKPVGKAVVILQPLASPQAREGAERPYGTRSDAEGRFAFDGVEPGRYRLDAEHSGYLRGSYGRRGGEVVTLGAGEKKTGAEVRLTLQSAIAGTVLDAEGDPAQNVNVRALRRTFTVEGQPRFVVVSVTMSGEDGKFRLDSLTPGHYAVVAIPTPAPRRAAPSAGQEMAPVSTFFPRAASPEGAQLLTLEAGQEFGGNRIQLLSSPVFHVRGTAPVQGDPNSRALVMLSAQDPSTAGVSTRTAPVARDGTFDLERVPPGDYMLRLNAPNVTNRSPAERVATGRVAVQFARRVEVTNGDLAGISFEPVAPIALTGTVHAAAPLPSGLLVRFTGFGVAPAGPAALTAALNADGSFALPQIAPGRYRVMVTGLSKGMYEQSLKQGNEERLGIGLNLSGDAAATIAITLAADAPSVSGTVHTSAGAACAGCSVVLLPEKRERSDLYRVVSCGPDGHYQVMTVPPGRYTTLAAANLEPGDQFDPEYLKAHRASSKEVAVESGVDQDLNLLLQ